MTPLEIINRIADFALDEVDADNNLTARILNDVNFIYRQVQADISPRDEAGDYATTTTLSLVAGSVTIPSHLRVYSVYDVTTDRLLTKSDILSLEQMDPSLDQTGDPKWYYVTGSTTMNGYPANNNSLRIRYYPTANTLASDGVEADIRIPVEFHDVLELGGIWKMAIREQGFHDALDRREKKSAYEFRLRQLKSYFSNKNQDSHLVEYHD